MSKLLKGLAAVTAVVWAGTAQASVTLVFSGDFTLTNSQAGPYPPTIETFSTVFWIEAPDWNADRWFLIGTPYAGDTCAMIQLSSGKGCLTPTWSENSLSFTAPEFSGFYASLSMWLSFDADIIADPTQISPETFTGGGLSYNYAHGGYASSLQGRLTSLALPEPATWAMMLVGFGLTGAAMRRRPGRQLFSSIHATISA